MAKTKKEEKNVEEEVSFDFIWIILLFSILFIPSRKDEKVINIYMGDDE